MLKLCFFFFHALLCPAEEQICSPGLGATQPCPSKLCPHHPVLVPVLGGMKPSQPQILHLKGATHLCPFWGSLWLSWAWEAGKGRGGRKAERNRGSQRHSFKIHRRKIAVCMDLFPLENYRKLRAPTTVIQIATLDD